MNGSDAEWAADQIGNILRARKDIAATLVAGEYESARNLARTAIETSEEVLQYLDQREPRGRLYRALASEVRLDYQIADVLAGHAGFEVESGSAIGHPFGDEHLPEVQAAPRECMHGEASWDGTCVSRPPCPRDN
jgi:hypothetical protein